MSHRHIAPANAPTGATGVTVRFDGDGIVIDPEAADLQGPEIAMLDMDDPEHAWTVWRPGEGSFANRDW